MGGMNIDDQEVSASGLADADQAGGKRRRWPEAVKRELVAALSEPGASVSIVARRYDVNANQLFKWRRQFGVASNGTPVEPVRMLPVEITPASMPSARLEWRVRLASPQRRRARSRFCCVVAPCCTDQRVGAGSRMG